MEVTGTIKLINETKTFGDKGFQKRDMVVTTDEKYPQHILIEFIQDNCALLDNFAEGQSVKIGINLRGREWVSPQGETKYFNSVQGWRIDPEESQSAPQSATNDYDNNSQQGTQDEDPLPF
jgi:hypothetical protein